MAVKSSTKTSQIEKFRALAREHKADESEHAFNDALKRVAKSSQSSPEKKTKKPDR